MPPSSHLAEARRWVKFPATVLLAMALLWLLQNLFTFNQAQIGQSTESFVGAAYVFIELIVIPLGSVAVGIGLLFLQRWALLTGFFLPLLPLFLVTSDKLQRISAKFEQYRASGDFSSFGGGVMTSLLVIALWAAFALYIQYLFKSWRLTNQAREWLSPRKGAAKDTSGPPKVQPKDDAPGASDEVCFLMPEGDDEEQP